jgi:hypothetical protein
LDSINSQPPEDTIRKSELRYQTLFESLSEGFCTIEMIFDAAGKPTGEPVHFAPHMDRVLSKPPKLRELREALARRTSCR